MPQIFKAFATINAWALFIVGWISLLAGFARLIVAVTGAFSAPAEMLPIAFPLAGGFIGLILSVCAMKLRQMLE